MSYISNIFQKSVGFILQQNKFTYVQSIFLHITSYFLLSSAVNFIFNIEQNVVRYIVLTVYKMHDLYLY